MPSAHVGPFDKIGDLHDAAALVEEAWKLVAAEFAEHQVREYAHALADGRPAPGRLHPWVPGLHWHRTHLGTGHTGPLPPDVLYVVQDMLALRRVPDVLPTHRAAVARRIRREAERALWEVRAAALYAPAGIRAEWSAITDSTPGAPDVRIPAFGAEIQVKCISPRDNIETDYKALFGALDDAEGQLEHRLDRDSEGPGAIVVVLPGARSLSSWDASQVFRASMDMRLRTANYRVVSAMVFVAEPVVEMRGSFQFYGAPAWHIVNPNAAWPWPSDLPLVSND